MGRRLYAFFKGYEQMAVTVHFHIGQRRAASQLVTDEAQGGEAMTLVTWLDRTVFGVRVVLWQRPMGWWPTLHRDAYGSIGWRIVTVGPLWVEWNR